MKLVVLFSIALSLSFIVAAQTPDGPGSIEGVVLDEFGQPMQHTQVTAMLLEGEKMITGFNAHTDGTGSFRYEHLQIGDYGLYAGKLEAGYRDTNDPCSDRRLVPVKLTADAPSGRAVLRFAPKAGALVGSVTDAKTGERLNAILRISIARCLETTGVSSRYKFHHLVPADTVLTLEVTAKGYKPWLYADPSYPSQPLKFELSSGAELELNVQLEPDTSSNEQQ
jgi:hypothetical protein